MRKDGFSARGLTLSAVLVALAAGLSYAERFFPLQLLVPIPGIKLGLANVVTLVALVMLSRRQAFLILAVRCVLGSLLGGGPSALVFSLTGGLIAMGVMALLRDVKALSVYGVSVCGAAAHSAGQMLAATVMMQTTSVLAYLPVMLITSSLTGLFTGAISASVLRALIAAQKAPRSTEQPMG